MSIWTGASDALKRMADRGENPHAPIPRAQCTPPDEAVAHSPAKTDLFWRSKSLHAFVWMLVVLAGVEVAVRARAVTRYGWSRGLEGWLAADDDNTGALKPGVTKSSGGIRTTVNRWGLRGHDFALHKPQGVVRVLCLGESTTFGQPCDDDEAIWPARLEQRLNGLGPPVEVINAAAPGQTIEQSAANLDRLRRFEPDVVIVYHAATNVAAHTRRQFAGETNTGGSVGLEPQLAHLRDQCSLAYMLMRRNTTSWLSTQFQRQQDRRLDDRGVNRFENELIDLAERCRDYGIDVAFCTFPRAFDESQPINQQARLAESALFFNPQLTVAGLNDAYERYNRAIRAAARRTGARLIDLDGAIDPGDRNFIDSVHLSATGHEAVAHRVAQSVNDWMSARALANAVQ